MLDNSYNISNINCKWLIVQLLSLLRIFCAIGFYFTWNSSIIREMSYLPLFLFTGIFITDFLDGKLARFWKVTSRFGSILDPICDKVSIYILMYTFCGSIEALVKNGLFSIMVCKDLLVILGGFYTQYRFKKAVLTTLGKSTMVFIGLHFLSLLLVGYGYKIESSFFITRKDICNFQLSTDCLGIGKLASIISISAYIVQYLYLVQKAIRKNKL